MIGRIFIYIGGGAYADIGLQTDREIILTGVMDSHDLYSFISTG